MTALLMAIFAHILGDFIFQTDKIASEKKDVIIKGFVKHGLIIFLTSFLMLSLQYDVKTVLLYSLSVSILHIIIDYLNCTIKKKFDQFQEWILFLSDQIIHLIIIFIGWNFLEFNFNNYINNFFSMIIKPKTIFVFSQVHPNIYSDDIGIKMLNKILIYGSVYLFFCIGGGYFISKILQDIGNEIQSVSLKNIRNRIEDLNLNELEKQIQWESENEGIKKAGKLIGILERVLIITLVINNSLVAIGFVITAKSIARYDKITTKKEFAEYFLIGTFLSVLIGMIGGYTLIGMISIFV